MNRPDPASSYYRGWSADAIAADQACFDEMEKLAAFDAMMSASIDDALATLSVKPTRQCGENNHNFKGMS